MLRTLVGLMRTMRALSLGICQLPLRTLVGLMRTGNAWAGGPGRCVVANPRRADENPRHPRPHQILHRVANPRRADENRSVPGQQDQEGDVANPRRADENAIDRDAASSASLAPCCEPS